MEAKPTNVVLLLAMLITHKTVNPIIVQGPSDTTTVVNGSTYFNCSTSMRNVTWYHYPVDGERQRYDVYDEGRILTNYRNRFSIDRDISSGSFNLLAKKLELKDAGRYECVDDVHEGKSASAELTVLGSNLVCEYDMNLGGVDGPAQCDMAIIPDELRISCSVTYDGVNAPQMLWRKSGVSSTSHETKCVTKDKRVTCHTTLTANLQLSGSVFYCELDNQQYNCSLEIPKISYVFSGKAIVILAIDEEIKCSANSTQSCRYKWKWFNESDSLTVSADQILKATRVGSHRCEATCDIGNTFCVVNVMFAEVHSTEGTTAQLSIRFILPLFLVLIIIFIVILYWRHKCANKRTSTSHHKTLDNNSIFLRENIDTEGDLLECMFRKKAITSAQMNFISAEPEPFKRSKTLLDIIRRGTQWQFEKTIEALKASKQGSIADVFLHGGMVLSVQSKADANFPTIDPAEEKVVHQLYEFLQGVLPRDDDNCSAAYFLLKHKGLISARRKKGIVFFFHCQDLEQLNRLQSMMVSNQMKENISIIYNKIIPTSTVVEIEVTWEDNEFKKAESMLQEIELTQSAVERKMKPKEKTVECQSTPPDELSPLLTITDKGMVDKLAINKYFIDSGTSGAIYAPFRWRDKKCALKRIMFSREEETEDMEEKIQKKADRFDGLEHPQVIKLFEVWFSSPALYIIMEYAEGESLDKILRPKDASYPLSPFPPYIIQDWALQIADGMRYLHSYDLVHRRLKPAHVLVMELPNPWPKTLKIGSYTLIKDCDHATIMSFKRTMGWMAPECINGEPFSKMSDVWSYGITIWEMLTRDIPFKEVKKETDLVREAMNKTLKLQIPESCSVPLQDLLTQCWHYKVDRRPSFLQICDRLKSTEDIRV